MAPEHFEALHRLPNVHFRPRVPRAVVSAVVAGADVGLVLHVQTEFTEAMSRPLKLYEYLAAGKPAVAVETARGLRGLSDRLLTVPPNGDMVAATHEALRLGAQTEADRLAFIDANSWGRRYEELFNLALAVD